MAKLLLMVFCLFLAEAPPEEVPFEDDFNPGLGIFALIAVFFIIAIFGLGVAIGLAIIAATGTLVVLGVLTSSALVGYLARKPSSAVKALILQGCAFCGALAGFGGGFIAHFWGETEVSGYSLVGFGALGGLIGGVVLALVCNALWPRLFEMAKAKLVQLDT